MPRVAIVTDSASDMSPDVAAAAGITLVPLVVNIGAETFKANVELTKDEFWHRVNAPGAPFPTTAASSPGDFRDAYERCFADGAEAVIVITVAGTLSGTLKSAQVAREMLPEREIHVIDSQGASMAEGILAEMGVEMAAMGVSATEIARVLESRIPDMKMVVILETIEWLRRGGRISAAQAAIGTFLSVKPIIEVSQGRIETADRVRTRAKARQRGIELICERPVERIAFLHTISPDVDEFREAVLDCSGIADRAGVATELVGPSIGPHLGPGCVGAAVLYRAS